MLLSQILSLSAILSLAVGTSLDSSRGSEKLETRDLVKRQCYGEGPSWGANRNHATDRAGSWCNGPSGSGVYRAGLRKTGCYNAVVGNYRYAF